MFRHRIFGSLVILASFLNGAANAAEPPLDISACINPGPQPPKLYSGLGDTHMPAGLTRENAAQAQRFFNQGLVYAYAFNKPEAVHSFMAAAAMSPDSALPYWGIALATSPDINSSHPSQDCLQLAVSATERATKWAKTPLETGLSQTMAQRFSVKGGKVTINASTYADAMAALAAEHPDDPHLATLYAAALLTVHPWKWWINGEETAEAAKARSVLSAVLQITPNHVGANHYFIHATEQSPEPITALPSAERMGDLVPGAGHILHMPSHIFRRIGEHAKASAANYAAVAADRAYIEQTPQAARYPLRYLSHNLQFLTISLGIEGRSTEALASAMGLYENVLQFSGNPFNALHNQTIITSRDDFFLTVPIAAVIRNRGWNDPLYARLTTEIADVTERFDAPVAKGFLAYAEIRRLIDQNAGAAQLQTAFTSYYDQLSEIPDGLSFDNNTAEVIFRLTNLDALARAVEDKSAADVKAILELARDRMADITGLKLDIASTDPSEPKPQITLMRRALEIEATMNYAEPPNWYYPMHEGLGRMLYLAGDYEQAEQIFRDGLAKHALHGRLLFGLIASLKAQDRPVPASLQRNFDKAWKNAPQPLTIDAL